jgi:hypothetical protein
MWHKRVRLGVQVGLALLIGGLIVSTMVNSPWYTSSGIGAVVFAGSLVGLVFTAQPDGRRTLILKLVAGFVALAVIAATLYTVGIVAIGCAMSPTTYNGLGCRAGSVYWPDILIATSIMWMLALGLIWLILQRASIDRP